MDEPSDERWANMSLARSLPKPTRVTRIIAGTGLAIVGLLATVLVFRALFILFAGLLYAVALSAVARWVSRTGIPYGIALAGIVVVGASGTVASGVLLAPGLTDQVQELSKELPTATRDALARLNRTPVVGPTLEKAANSAAPKAEPRNLAKMLVATLGGTVDVLGGLVVIFFIGVYGAAQPAVYLRAALEVTPRRYRTRVSTAFDKIVTNLTRWLLGRFAAMAFVGVTTAVCFHFLHIPLAALLGAVAGLLTFVEYIGAVASAVPPLVLALARSPETAIAVVVIYTAVHLVEGYVLTPLFARAAVKLPPALTLSSQLLFGTLAGPLGLTFSTPLLVVAVSAVGAWRESELKASF